MTFHDDRLKRPGSLTAKKYDEAKITCTNIGCTTDLKIDKINHHEFFQCPVRLIKCPATRCNYKNTPSKIHQHALRYPYQEFYCERCFGVFSAEVLKDDCIIKLQQWLEDNIKQPFPHHPEIANHRTGDVILPPHVTHYPFDMEALTDAQVGPLIPLPLSSNIGLTGLAPRLRRHVIQRQEGLPNGHDEVDARSNESEDNLSQFNLI